MDDDKAPVKINGEKQIYSTKDKVCVMGTAPTMADAPYDDADVEIWALAQCVTFETFKRGDIFFELHTADFWRQHPNVVPRINKTPGRIVMQDHYKDVPKSEKYPIETILKYKRYHRTSITYMLALAYHSYKVTGKPGHVSLYGVHMEDEKEEYGEQRPCCEYWIGRMEDAGQEIFIAGGAVLSAPFLYGFEEYNPITLKLRQRFDGLVNGLKQTEINIRAAQDQKQRQDGAIAEDEYWLRLAQRGELNDSYTS